MNIQENFAELQRHFMNGYHILNQLANIGDFINYRALKRCSEYYGLKCVYDNRNLSRYLIGVCGVMPKHTAIEIKDIIPSGFYSSKRTDVDVTERAKYSKYIVDTIYEWLGTTKTLLEKNFREATAIGGIAVANEINGLIKCYTKELKYFERKKLECDNVQYGAHHMERIDGEWHDEYREKTNGLEVGEL